MQPFNANTSTTSATMTAINQQPQNFSNTSSGINAAATITTKEEIIALMGTVPYEEGRTPAQNLMRFLIHHKTAFPSAHEVVICGLDLSFEGETKGNEPVTRLNAPNNLKFINCRLVSPGEITSSSELTAMVACAEVNVGRELITLTGGGFSDKDLTGIVVNANADGAKARASGAFSVANANVLGSEAVAVGSGAQANANAKGSVARAIKDMLLTPTYVPPQANANAPGTLAISEGLDLISNANAPGATAQAEDYATANANTPNSFVELSCFGSGHANAPGAVVKALMPSNKVYGNVPGAILVTDFRNQIFAVKGTILTITADSTHYLEFRASFNFYLPAGEPLLKKDDASLRNLKLQFIASRCEADARGEEPPLYFERPLKTLKPSTESMQSSIKTVVDAHSTLQGAAAVVNHIVPSENGGNSSQSEVTQNSNASGEYTSIGISPVPINSTVYASDHSFQQSLNLFIMPYLKNPSIQLHTSYYEAGGIYSAFCASQPKSNTVTQIHRLIQENFKSLSTGSLVIGNNTICLYDGVDFISSQEFDNKVIEVEKKAEVTQKNQAIQITEWCLLKQANTYNFITSDTAEHLIHSGNKHPFTQQPLKHGDILRGEEVLRLLKQGLSVPLAEEGKIEKAPQ